MAILDANKYSLPYSGACRLVRKVGCYNIYKLKQKGNVVYGVMRGKKVVYFADTLSKALQYLGVNNGEKKEASEV